MPKDIRFPEVEPRYVFERDCLAFPASMDGQPIECLVTLELLMARFGVREPSEEAMRQAYREHRIAIQAIARNLIEYGWIDTDNRVFLTTRYTRLTVNFDDLLAKDQRVATAHRMLTDVIGASAGEIIIEWRTSRESPPHPSIHLSVKDPAIRREISTSFPPKALADLTILRVLVAQVWSALLMARSHDLVLKSG
jgi:hypothetical protein